MVVTLDPETVNLFDNYYKIIGPVQQSLVDPFPPRVVQGDPSRVDAITASSWEQSDWTGGLGVENGTKDTATRYHWATLDTRFLRQLTLPPLVSYVASLGATTVQALVSYNGLCYAFTNSGANSVYASPNFSVVAGSPSLVGITVYDTAVWRGTLYYSTGTKLNSYNGTTWAEVQSGGVSIPAKFLCVLKNVLYILETDGTLAYTTDGTTFNNGAKLYSEHGTPVQLLTAYDRNGNPNLFALTSTGLWGVDSDTPTVFISSMFRFPNHPNVGKAITWQGNLYVPVGGTVYKYDAQSVQVVGPDRDDGLPTAYRGKVLALESAHPGFFGVVNNQASTTQWVFDTTNHLWVQQTVPASGASLLFSNGAAWGIVWSARTQAGAVSSIPVLRAHAASDGSYKLYLAGDDGIYSLDLPTTLINPLQNTTAAFASSGQLVTSWFDADWAVVDKIGLRLTVQCSQATSTETVQVEYTTDGSTTYTSLGTITKSGETTFVLDEPDGITFRKIRLRLTLSRGSNTALTPKVESVSLAYVKMPDAVYGYQLTIDATKGFGNRSKDQVRGEIEEIVAGKKAGTFRWRRDDDYLPIRETQVLPTQMRLIAPTGDDPRTRIQLSLLQVGK